MSRKVSLIVFITISFFGVYANRGVAWNDTSFSENYFIENRGQYNSTAGKHVAYGLYQGIFNVYFNSDLSLTYEMGKTVLEEDGESKEKGKPKREEEKFKIEKTIVSLQWKNANPSAQIVAEDALSFPHHFAVKPDLKTKKANTLICKTYKKIILKNIYNHVDIEYLVDRRGGIKYNIILHPGADVSQIELVYNNYDKIEKDIAGNILVSTSLDKIIDHAPVAFFKDGSGKIECDFILKSGSVLFQLKGIANIEKPVVIDPWTTTIGAGDIPNSKAYDMGVDTAGNVYVYGGGGNGAINNLRLVKYNSFGVKQWAYTPGVIDYLYYGDLAVMPNGQCFMAEGVAYNNTRSAYIEECNKNGSFVDYHLGGGDMEEVWRLAYNCSNNRIAIGGGGTGTAQGGSGQNNPTTNVAYLNTSINSFMNATIVYWTECCHDAVGVTQDVNGDVYMLLSEPTYFNGSGKDLIKFTSGTWNYNVAWSVPHGYNFEEIKPNGIYPSILSGTKSIGNGMNSITHFGNYVFTYDGLTLKRWNKSNGSASGFINVTNGQFFTVGGIAADACGNLFVGTKAGVDQYDINLNFVSTQNMTGNVYDVVVGRTGKVYACGNGFVSETAFSTTCTATAPITASISATSSCGTVKGTATVSNVTGGIPGGYSYLWNNGNTTTTITNLNPGVYNVTIRDIACPPNSKVITVTVVAAASPTFSISLTNVACAGLSTGSATANVTSSNGTVQYTWVNSLNNIIGNSATQTGLAAGTYSCTVIDASGCPTTLSVTITQPNNGAVTLSTLSTQSVTCNPGANGTINVVASGGSPGYTYILLPTNITNSNGAFTGLSGGTYSVSVTDLNGCSTGTVVVITLAQPAPFVLNADSSQNISCAGFADGMLNIGATGGTPSYSYTLMPGGVVNTTGYFPNLTAGTYTVFATDQKNCTATAPQVVQLSNSSNGIVIANHDFDSVSFNTVKTVDIYQNDTGSVSTITILVQPANGTVQSLSNGVITYKPNTGFSGGDSLKYVICDQYCTSKCDTTWVLFKVLPEFIISIPTAFSPDGDGINDNFVIRNIERFPDNRLEIYNRWGGLIYTAEPYMNKWDGTCNTSGAKIGNEKVISGTYFYILNITITKKETYKGYIELRR